MIDVKQLRNYVIRPTLEKLDMWNLSAENLLVGTAAQESNIGSKLVQVPNGPALGIYQIEPNTDKDVWDNFLEFKASLALIVNDLLIPGVNRRFNLIVNLAYQTAIARLVYYRASESLPESEDIVGLAAYWKKYFNTPKGKGEPKQFIENYKRVMKNA